MTGKASYRIRLGLRIAAPLILAGMAAAPAFAAGTGGTHGYNGIQGDRHFQPEQKQVLRREKHAGIAYSPKKREQQIKRINRKLAQDAPIVRKTFAQNPVTTTPKTATK